MNQKDQKNNETALSSAEQKNRVLLVLFLVFLLGIFMDYQARRHYQSLPEERQGEAPIQESSLEEDIREGQEKLDKELEKYKGNIAEKTEPAAPVAAEKAENIIGSWEGLKEKIDNAVKKQTAAEIYEAHAGDIDASALLKKTGNLKETLKSSPFFPDEIQHNEKYYFLYFIRFNGKKSKIVRVPRPHNGGSLRLRNVLENLQKGPSIYEKGLLNNFNHRIKINSLIRNGRAAVIDTSPAIGRMGPHVIHDRLEQLAHTLVQFSEIEYVKITVDGQSPAHIGEAKVNLSQSITPERASFPFSASP